MKVLSAIFAFAMLLTSAATAKPRKWSQHEAIAEAQHDIRANNVKFYWQGGYASMPVGLPAKYAHIADRYPHADGGIVDDRAVRERQREYSETYNKLMLSYVLHKD